MDIGTRLRALLSRKFLTPVLAVLAFMLWKAFLSAIPIEVYATFVGALAGTFLLMEGVRDIVVAIKEAIDKTK